MSDNSRFFDELAIAVAGGSTIRDAARALELSEGRAYHITGSVEFKQRVNELRSMALSQAVGRLSLIAVEAVDALAEVLRSNEARDKLAAAKAILSSLGPLSEIGELRERLDRLEASQAGRGGYQVDTPELRIVDAGLD